MFHTSLTGLAKDATSWAGTVTGALVAAMLYAPDDLKWYLGTAAAVTSFLGVVLKGTPEAPVADQGEEK